MLLATKRWEIVGEIAADMLERAKGAKAAHRATLARQAARDALSALATVPGVEAAAARKLVAGLVAAITGGEP